MYALEVKNLNKKFKEFKIKDINFNLEPGYIMGYVGQNGSGKTTTIKLITNILKDKNSTIKIFGKQYSDDSISYLNMIGFISDEFYYPNNFTIKDVKKVLKDFYPSFSTDKYNEYINMWNLPLKTKVRDFSKGMKVKLMFAGVLARDTKLLILDEATSGLDPVIRNDILIILQDYIKDGTKSVLFSTHITEDLEKIADYIFFIDNGQKIFFDSVNSILESYTLIKGGVDDLSSNLKEKAIGLNKTKVGFKALIKTENLNLIDKSDLLVEKPTIDDIIVHIISQKRSDNNGLH